MKELERDAKLQAIELEEAKDEAAHIERRHYCEREVNNAERLLEDEKRSWEYTKQMHKIRRQEVWTEHSAANEEKGFEQ